MKRNSSYIFLSFLLVLSNIVLPAKSNENNPSGLQESTDISISQGTVLKGMASISDALKKNTKLKIAINQDLNSSENHVGDEFSATVLTDLTVNDINLIPVGSIIVGHIMDVMNAGKASMQGTMEISLDKIVLPSGKYIPLTSAKFAADKTYTNKNRSLKGEGTGLARGVGIGALKGATLTFIPGGKAVKATAVGIAATGAVFSGGWSLTSTAAIGGLTGLYYGVKAQGKEVMIASGQELEIELSQEQDLTPLEVAVDDLMNQGIQTTDSAETIIK